MPEDSRNKPKQPVGKIPVTSLCIFHEGIVVGKASILTCRVLNICVKGSIRMRKWQTIIDELK